MPELNTFNWLTDFHWLRPMWLVLIPVAIVLTWYFSKRQAASNSWRTLIDPELLPHLLQGQLSRQQQLPWYGFLIGITLAALAMAGPSWEKLPQPIHKTDSALVILLDLSPSMVAEDLKPARIVRARLKLIDLLQQRQEGLSALIAYAGEAHVVTPLTDDTDTIISLLPSLSPGVMPVRGSNPEHAVDQALRLFREAGLTQGDILLVSDGVAEDAKSYILKALPRAYRLSVLGVGTQDGAPIPTRNGGFAKDSSGAIVLAKLDTDSLQKLASAGGGIYQTLSHTDSDLEALLSQPDRLHQKTRELEREFDTWMDRGALLSVLLIPLMALCFRRGWLLCLPLLLIFPEPSQAFSWDDLWYTKDQQGQQLLQQDRPDEAAKTFKSEDWKGAAAYRAGDYEQAAKSFEHDHSANGLYNRGNALAKSGKLQEAIKAYTQAIEQQPGFDDAVANKELLESLLQQQEQPDQQDGSNSESQSQSKQDQAENNASNNATNNQGGDQNPQNSISEDDQDSESPNPQDTGDQSSETSQNSSEPNDETVPKTNQANSSTDQAAQQQTEAAQEDDHQNNADIEQLAEGEASQTQLSEEEQQAMEQWLRKIPDDPSGLMRKKFEYQYRQRRKEYQQGSWQLPENDANNRW